MKKKTILVIDDNEQVRGLLKEALKPQYKVIGAATSQDALDRLRKSLPDLIILDLVLPGSIMNGKELCADIKSREDWRHIPVLILSGQATIADIAELKQMGAEDYIAKPYSPVRLMGMIEILLRGQNEG